MAQSNCGRGGRIAPPGSNKRMGAKAGFVPRFCHHDTGGSPSISLAQKTGTIADFPIRHRGRAYSPRPRLNRSDRLHAVKSLHGITTNANELAAGVHDRMPLILAPENYSRWLGDEPDPADLMRPFSAGLMRVADIDEGQQARNRIGTNSGCRLRAFRTGGAPREGEVAAPGGPRSGAPHQGLRRGC